MWLDLWNGWVWLDPWDLCMYRPDLVQTDLLTMACVYAVGCQCVCSLVEKDCWSV